MNASAGNPNTEDEKKYRDAIALLESLQARYYHDPSNEDRRWTGADDAVSKYRTAELFESEGILNKRSVLKALADTSNVPLRTKYENPIYQRILDRTSLAVELIAGRTNGNAQKIILGSAPTGRFSGTAFYVPGQQYQVVLIEDGIFGLSFLLSKIVVLLAPKRRMFPKFWRRDYNVDPKEHLERHPTIALRFADLCVSYVCRGSPYKAKPHPLPLRMWKFQNMIETFMVLFIVAHEHAHIILDHWQNPTFTEIALKDGSKLNPQQYLELEADTFALHVVLEYAKIMRTSPRYAYASIEVLFHFLDKVEACFDIYQPGLKERRRSADHPEYATRVWNLRHQLIRQLPNEPHLVEYGRMANYYNSAIGELWKQTNVLMGAVAKDFGAKPHEKWLV